MTRRGHAGDMGEYDLPDENLTDCLLQAEVVRACLCQQRAPWRCQDHTMDPVGSVAGRWRLEAEGGVERSRIKHEAGVVATYHKYINSCLAITYIHMSKYHPQ